MASLHTSTMPSRHGVVAVDTGLPPSLPLLAEQLQGMGYVTAFFTNGVNISPDIGYGRGVEHFDVPQMAAAVERTPVFSGLVLRVFPALRSRLRHTTGSSSPDERNEKVLEWVRGVGRARPVFLYVHYMGPHEPYMPPEEFSAPFSDRLPEQRLANPPPKDGGRNALTADDREQMIAQYDGEILMHDFHLDYLLGELRAIGWLDSAVIVITADHGEAFGEHGVWSHGRGLFEEVVRVPLIIWSTFPWNQHRRLDVPVSLIDLAPTLVDLAGGTIPEAWDGNSLRPWLVGDRDDNDRVVFQEHVPWDKALRNAEWSYLESDFEGGSGRWLYLSSDTNQENDLARQYPLQVQEFHDLVHERAAIDSSKQAGATKLVLDEATTERLRALGYVD
jgi:arylsulfatase A-like enzyme